MRTTKVPVRAAVPVRRAGWSGGGRAPRMAPLGAERIAEWLSFTYPFALILLILFNPQISPLGPALQILATLMVALFLLRTRPRAVLAEGWIMLVGAVCVVSTIWSVAPELSLRAGVQVSLTLLSGIVIGLMPRQDRMIAAIFLGFLFYVAASFVIGGSVALGNNGAEALSGLNNSKNYFAANIVFLMTSAAAVAVLHTGQWRGAMLLAAAASVPLGLAVLVDAQSATATIASAASVALFGLAYLALRLSRRARLMLIGAGLLSLAPLALVREDIETAVVGGTLATFHKNAGLTGREALWKSADRIIATRPVLGRGYYTFWVRGNPAAELLWYRNHIQTRFGFNFHNSPREMLVGLGWVGFGIIMSVVLAGLAMLVLAVVLRPTPAVAFWLAIAGCIMLRFWTEAIFPVPFAIETVLLGASLAIGRQALRDRAQGVAPPTRPALRG